MKALVLTGVSVEGMRPVTDTVPPCLVRVAGMELLGDVIHHLAESGMRQVVVACSGDGDPVREASSRTCRELGMDVEFLQEPLPSGSAAAAEQLRDLLGDRFLAVASDVLSRQPPAPLVALHESSGASLSLSISPAAFPEEETVVFTAPDGSVESVRRNPPPEESRTNLAFSGMLVCDCGVLEFPAGWSGAGPVPELVPMLAEAGLAVKADTTGGYARRVSTPERLLLACHDVFSGRVDPWYGPTPVDSGRLVEGTVREGTSIEGFLWSMEDSVVESGSQLENCVVMWGSRVEPGVRLRNAIVLPGTRVESGTDCSDKYISVLGRPR